MKTSVHFNFIHVSHTGKLSWPSSAFRNNSYKVRAVKTITKVLFAYLIIRPFQLFFLAGTVFFSHNKSTRIVFRLVFSVK